MSEKQTGSSGRFNIFVFLVIWLIGHIIMSIIGLSVDFVLGDFYDLRGVVGDILYITSAYILPIVWAFIVGFLLKLQFGVGLRRWTLLTTIGVVSIYVLYRPVILIDDMLYQNNLFTSLPIFWWLQLSLLLILGFTQAFAMRSRFQYWWAWIVVPLIALVLVDFILDPIFFYTRFNDGGWIVPYGAAIGVVAGLFTGGVLWGLTELGQRQQSQ